MKVIKEETVVYLDINDLILPKYEIISNQELVDRVIRGEIKIKDPDSILKNSFLVLLKLRDTYHVVKNDILK